MKGVRELMATCRRACSQDEEVRVHMFASKAACNKPKMLGLNDPNPVAHMWAYTGLESSTATVTHICNLGGGPLLPASCALFHTLLKGGAA